MSDRTVSESHRAPLDPERLFAVLARHAVDYVLIGGLAAVLHGSALVTNDADICPNRDPENLARLADALRELDARVRTPSEPGGVAFACDAELLARMQMSEPRHHGGPVRHRVRTRRLRGV